MRISASIEIFENAERMIPRLDPAAMAQRFPTVACAIDRPRLVRRLCTVEAPGFGDFHESSCCPADPDSGERLLRLRDRACPRWICRAGGGRLRRADLRQPRRGIRVGIPPK